MKRRITDNGELRYSLRSIRKYASWIEKIHIITNGHPPCWLDLSHPAINHVIHEEIFPDTSVLPTFNSYAIECNLHRISSLSPCFLYFNDDFFLGRSIEVSTFIRDDELRFYAVPHTIGAKRDEEHSIYYNSAVYSQNYMRSRIGVSPLTHFRAKWLFLLMKLTLQRLFPEPAPWEKDQYTL
jgi:hypothetical protein